MITVLRLSNVPLRGLRILQLGPCVIQTATLTSRSTRGGPLKLKRPFPYECKKINRFYEFLDPTVVRVAQENAKIIAVEGPIGVGKSAFCKVLAEEFDMHYLPQVTMDRSYLLPSGYDLRQHDDELPEEVRSYDHKNFCVDPCSKKAGRFQIDMLYWRFHQYTDAICHLLNTGQGVVVERNLHADYVFMNAMYKNKYVSKAVFKAYNEIYRNTTITYPGPHLVIYLDIPVPVVQERIRTRNYSYEQNSPALTPEYLKSLEEFWKLDYLKFASQTSEILVYDWTDGGDVDVVIDDIEKLDFDIMRQDKKFIEWWFTRKDLRELRMSVTNKPFDYDSLFYYPTHAVDELFIPTEDVIEKEKLLDRIPECRYERGYNPDTGDGVFNILFKLNREDHRAPRHYLSARSFVEA